MYEQLKALEDETVGRILDDAQNIFYVLMGNQPELMTFQSLVEIQCRNLIPALNEWTAQT